MHRNTQVYFHRLIKEKFTDGLEKWAKERDKRQKKRRQDASAVELLAVKKDVTEAIEAGYSPSVRIGVHSIKWNSK